MPAQPSGIHSVVFLPSFFPLAFCTDKNAFHGILTPLITRRRYWSGTSWYGRRRKRYRDFGE